MLGDFFTRILILLIGYAYPAFECYKTVEKNNPEIQELRYWCKYWMLVALLTVFERVGDVFVSWLPMYGEMKVALLIYLLHPKTKGTSYVYEMLLRPYVARHELDIDRNITTLRTRGFEIFGQFWQCCFRWIQTNAVRIFLYLQDQSAIDQTHGRSKPKQSNQSNSLFGLSSVNEPIEAWKSPHPQSPARTDGNVTTPPVRREPSSETKQPPHTPRIRLFFTRIGITRRQSPSFPPGSAS